MTLQTKYLLLVNGLLLAILLTFFAIDIHKTERIMTQQAIESLHELGDAFKSAILSQKELNPDKVQQAIRCFRALREDIEIMVLDKDSRVLASTSSQVRGRIWEEKEIWEILRGSSNFRHQIMTHNGVKVLDIILPLDKGEKIIAALHVSKSLPSINFGLQEMKKSHILNIIVNVLLLSFLVNFLTYRFIIKRLHSLSESMEKVGQGEMQMPTSMNRQSDEIGRLERTFSAMVEKITSATARLQETLAERERLLLQIKGFNLELERKIQEVTARLEAAHHELRHKEKLATVGQLTAGIAHEIRNPLLIIKGSAEFLQKRIPDQKELIQDIREEVDRVNRIVTELLDYARPLSPDIQEVCLRALLDQAWSRVQRLTQGDGKDILYQMETPEPFAIEADPSLLEQALVNLLLNARQTISREGKISIRATDMADGFSHILIADNGNGILPGDLTNVFSPFFTKRKGGTGLGLSITQKIIEAHGGDVVIESRVQKGTMVIIRIPREPRVPNEQGLCP